MGWTDERIEELKKLWAEGKSASIVAEEMNKMFGTKLTRNSIIGKIHRLLDAGKMLARSDQKPTKAKEPKERSKHYKKQAEAIAPPPVLAKPAAFAKVHPVSLGENVIMFPVRAVGTGPATLENVKGCLYAVGFTPRGQHLFCNEERREGSSYCPEHHAKCHVPVQKTEKEVASVLVGRRSKFPTICGVCGREATAIGISGRDRKLKPMWMCGLCSIKLSMKVAYMNPIRLEAAELAALDEAIREHMEAIVAAVMSTLWENNIRDLDAITADRFSPMVEKIYEGGDFKAALLDTFVAYSNKMRLKLTNEKTDDIPF